MNAPLPATVISVLVLLAGLSHAQSVGTVAGLQTQVVRQGSVLAVGSSIFPNDTVTTNDTGISQFQFKDRSSAKLGPNSQVTFSDEIIQIAGRRSSIAVRMVSGIGRFVGSDATKDNPLVVETPNIALGVLGGHLDVVVASGETTAILQSGTLVCQSSSQRKVVRKSGFGCVGFPNGQIEIAKIDQSLTLALDSTAIPNASGSSGGNAAVSSGPAPIQLDRVNQPLTCGSGAGANAGNCNLSGGGGYPYPQLNQKLSSIGSVTRPPAGSAPVILQTSTPTTPTPPVNTPPTGTLYLDVTPGAGGRPIVVDDINNPGASADIVGINSLFSDLDGDTLTIVSPGNIQAFDGATGGPYACSCFPPELTAVGNGFSIGLWNVDVAPPYLWTVDVSDGTTTATLQILMR